MMTEDEVMEVTGRQSPDAYTLWMRLRKAWVGPGRRLQRRDVFAWRTWLEMHPSDRASCILDARRYLDVLRRGNMMKYRVQLNRFIMDPKVRDPDAWWRRKVVPDDQLPDL